MHDPAGRVRRVWSLTILLYCKVVNRGLSAGSSILKSLFVSPKKKGKQKLAFHNLHCAKKRCVDLRLTRSLFASHRLALEVPHQSAENRCAKKHCDNRGC